MGPNERLTEAVSRSWNRLIGLWSAFSPTVDRLTAIAEAGTGPTRERWLLPLFFELGFGRLPPAKSEQIDSKTYPISHRSNEGIPIHLVGAGIDLDHRTAGVVGAAKMSPHGLVQSLLNRTPSLWGIVSNGRRLRLLRDNASLTRQAYLEFDLERMMGGEAYADFALLWLVCHQSRFEGERPADCWLERWFADTRKQGIRALDTLRNGVERALNALGAGFLAGPRNGALRARLRSGEFSTENYYRQLLRLIYRLIFLFVADDRDLLHPPDASHETRSRYASFYSTARLRRLAERRRGTKHPDLYEAFKVVAAKLSDNSGCPELGLPALGSFLWSGTACPDLDRCQISNSHLLEAVRAVAFTEEAKVLRPVDYRNIGSEELGSIYESLLELHPEIHADAATFELRTATGHERKATGSYYTPSSLINILLDSTLDPVLDEAVRAEHPEQAILELRVCDPACGSGHFLVAAAHRIAKRLATVRTLDEEPSPEATTTALREVVGRCLFGVDVNPMAVELCKVALWMEALEPGRPLSFLDAHIRCGNSLLGTTPELLGAGIPDDAYKPTEGDERDIATELRRRNRQERDGQLTIDEAGPLTALSFLESALSLESASANSIAAVHAQEQGFRELFNSSEYQRSKLLDDAWCYAFVSPKRPDTPQVTQGVLRLMSRDGIQDSALLADIEHTADANGFFHWNTEFPTVFRSDKLGFDVVLGNPPFVNAIEGGIDEKLKRLLRFTHPHIGGTADLSYYFLSAALMHVRNGGRVGLVQPRALLNATPAVALRSGLRAGFRPNLLYAPPRSDFFAGPAVFIALVVLGPDAGCLVSRDVDPATAVWTKGVISSDNWWLAIGQLLGGPDDEPAWDGPSVGDVFTVVASMTTADAYDVAGAVCDEAKGSSPKLVTTGLIDPGQCLWGKVTCRYLKRDYEYPRLDESQPLTNSLQRRIAGSRRPKILVAGLSKRIECFVDRVGEYIGAVSTFSIFHPTDDVAALEALCEELLSEGSSRRFVAELGGSAMGGGNTTMKKSFLASLPYRAAN